jgi:hypothetical protein
MLSFSIDAAGTPCCQVRAEEREQDLRISCYIKYINYIPTNEQPEMYTQ